MKNTLLLIFLFPLLVFSQQFADKEYYLVDSLVLSNISKSDKHLIDSCLAIYHKSNNDSVKIKTIRYLTETCWDDEVWPRYNNWIYKDVKNKITNSKNSDFYKSQYAGSLNNIGYLYNSQGKVKQALEIYHSALKIQKEIGDLEGISTSLNNIGAIYNAQKQIDEALKYCKEALEIKIKLGNKKKIAMSLNNIGAIYNSEDKPYEALMYFKKALKIREAIGDNFGIGIAYNNIGETYFKQNKFDNALKYFQKSLKIQEALSNKNGSASSLTNIGKTHLKQGYVEEAKIVLTKSLALSKDIGSPHNISESSRILSLIAVEEGDYKTSYEMYRLFIKMRDSISSSETQKMAIQEEAKHKYETEKAIDDVEHKRTIAIEKEKKEKQKVISYAIALILGVAGLFLIIIFKNLSLTKKQKQTIEKTHQEITDSINYAKRLQNAILPAISDINQYLEQNFILFKPKDVVSGDFYWFEHKIINGVETSFIAAADCTGHGVPGAMVSVVCSNALHRAVNEFNITEPSKILDKTRELVIATFAKSGDNIKDGMDISLCTLSSNSVCFSGANNPLWIVKELSNTTQEQLNQKSTLVIKNKALIECKGNRQPIGLYEKMSPFKQTKIELKKGDSIYLFTDGYADQFGGLKGKKLKYRAFKKLLIENANKTMLQQKEILTLEFDNWKGDLEQIDDVCIIGIKIK